MIRRILHALVNRYRAARKRQQLRENRSLIARVRAEADAVDAANEMRRSGKE